MVALLIGLFLLGALLIIVQTNKRVFVNQNQLAQLQDGERMALTVISDVLQSAGYFPDPTTNTLAMTLTQSLPFAVGQSVYGVSSGTPAGEQLYVRYMTTGGDGILNCSGQSNPIGGPNTLYVNMFQVLNGQLVCTMNGTQYNLVSGVTNMTIQYGVKANAVAPGNNVDTYMTAAQVNAAGLWDNVIAALVQVTFTNPMYVPGQTGQPATVSIQRVISVMNQTGPTL
jgi:type IV pilus assembly protein PilW